MTVPKDWRCLPKARAGVWLGALLQALVLAGAAEADEVQVKGQTLEGKVVGVSSDGVMFETVLGKGTIVIPFADVEELQSDERFVVLHGDDGELRGRLVGVRGEQLLVGDDPATATPVETDSIFRSFTVGEYDASGIETLRARYRYWHAELALSFAATQATNDTSNFAVDFDVDHRSARVFAKLLHPVP